MPKEEKDKKAEKDEAKKGNTKVDAKDDAKKEEKDAKSSSKKKRSSRKKSVPLGHIYIHASFNNTIVTITEPNGNIVCWSSAGSSGFKGSRKSTPYAAQIAVEHALTKAKAFGLEKVHVFVKGIGIGRDQALRAIPQQKVEIESISDRTTIAHGGCRQPRVRKP